MPAVSLRTQSKLARNLGLMASASIMSMMMAGEAQAQCVANPAQPLNNITTNGTIVSCTGTVNTPTIQVNTDSTLVSVAGPGTNVTGANIDINGNNNTLLIQDNAVMNGSQIDIVGISNELLINATTNNLRITIAGGGTTMTTGASAQVTTTPGDINVFAAPGQVNVVNLFGFVGASGSNGSHFLITGGTGNQIVNVAGFLQAPTNGFGIATGAGNDTLNIQPGANVTTQGGLTPIIFDGGADADTIRWASGNVAVTHNADVVNFETAVFSGGAGLLTMRGSADYADVSVIGGTVRIDDMAALGASNANVAVASGATLELNVNATNTLNQSFSGAGTIRQVEGVNILAGNSSGFSGTYIVDFNRVILGNANALGTADIVNNSLVFVSDFTVANDISGTGQVAHSGPGVGTLSGNNSFTGDLGILSGSIRLTNVNAGGLNNTIRGINAGTFGLELDIATDGTLTNNIGSGIALTKSGAGIVTLTGTNTYGSGTAINGGGIRVDAFARLGTGGVTTASGTQLILNYNGAGQLLQTSQVMTGAGTFVKEGTGEIVMGVANTYTGGTRIDGGTIRMGPNDSLGSGGILISANGILALGTGGYTPIITNDISGNGNILIDKSNGAELSGDNTGFSGTISLTDPDAYVKVRIGEALGSSTVQLVGANSELQIDNAFDTTVLANLAGIGRLEKEGVGRAILAGDGSQFAGTVHIDEGILQITGSQNVGTGAIFVANAATLQLDAAGSSTLTNDVQGMGGVAKTGTGTVFLTGNNTYGGGTDIQQGAIRVADLNALGAGAVTVQSGAALDLSISGSATFNGAISGAGILRKSDIGDLTLISNTLTGGLDIVGGRVIVSTVGALGTGPVTTAADTQLVFTNSTTEVSNTLISGAGTLTMNGTGSLVISNANSYTGGTLINSGRIGLNNGQGLGTGNVIVLSGATLGIGNVTLANNVSGAGQIVKTASGVGALTGTNTHTGGVDIQGGSLDVTGSVSLGTETVSIASGASLNYTNNSALTFSNGLTGAGTFNKLGTGQLTFGNNFSIGILNLNAGRTRINTIGTANVTVGANATLDGTGRIIGNLTNSGTVAPGNSIGTLTVQGNYVQNAGSVLEIEFDGSGGIDLLAVTGSATLNGGTLRFVSLGGAEGQGGTFLTATGGVTGTFATVETVGAQLPLAVIYNSNNAQMAPSVLTARPSTFNAQSLAAADTALGFVNSIGVAELRNGNGNRIWLNGFGAWGKRSASGSTLAYDHETKGMSGGVNIDAGHAITVGVAFGWAKGDITLGDNGGGGDQSSMLGSIHARYSGTGLTLGGGLLYGSVDQETLRNVSFNGFFGSVSGSTKSKLFGGYAELGLPLGSSGGWAFSANARGSYIRQKQDAYTESGTSPLRLTLGDLDTSTLEGRAGLSAKTSLWDRSNGGEETPEGLDLRINLGLRYLDNLGDRAIPVTFAASNAGVVLQGDTRNSVHGAFGLGLDYTIRSGATFSLGYQGELGQTDRHAVQAGVSFAF